MIYKDYILFEKCIDALGYKMESANNEVSDTETCRIAIFKKGRSTLIIKELDFNDDLPEQKMQPSRGDRDSLNELYTTLNMLTPGSLGGQ